MSYSTMLRESFGDAEISAGDLLLLEKFQVGYLPGRVPQKEFAALILSYPHIKEFLELKDPSIASFLDSILEANKNLIDKVLIAEYCEEALWEIADLIVYNKYPGLYDEKAGFDWTIDEIINKEILKGKIIADVGAGSGKLAFLLAKYAETIFAIEPLSAFRTFMKQTASRNEITNLFVSDGFLESIQMPANSLDMLFTSNAIGWNIEKELREIERVVKPNGQAIHIMRTKEITEENPVHEILTSRKWDYEFSKTDDENGLKAKYVKTIN